MLYHIVGESYVDLLCYLQDALPKQSEDSVLVEPVQTLAGGSTVNTATHLRDLLRSSQDSSSQQVVVQTVLNPNDEYGALLQRHCAEHDIPIINCCDHNDDETNQARSSSTPHCVVMVSEGDRCFMTHRGCAEQFTGRHVRLPPLWDHDGPVTLHVAGWYCTPGLGRDGSLVEAVRRLRRERHALWPQHRTVVSAVAQFDVQQQWDGGIDDLVPHLQFLILNQVEVHKIVQRANGTLHSDNDDEVEYTMRDWMSFFASLSTETVVVVTRGAEGAIAFRGEHLIGDTGPAVAVEAVDPTGAGDAFAAGFLYGIQDFEEQQQQTSPNNKHDDNAKITPWPSDGAVMHGLSWGCAVGTAAVTVRGASIPASNELIVELKYKQQQQQQQRSLQK